ncbi:MAG: hypothetical protein O2826_08405 [Chloroflexi bacterium]|nr:hypothetical protein [Chloroflexota bacterium]MDA1174521.1 hypothetical protein [Chloroflexota bacterium]
MAIDDLRQVGDQLSTDEEILAVLDRKSGLDQRVEERTQGFILTNQRLIFVNRNPFRRTTESCALMDVTDLGSKKKERQWNTVWIGLLFTVVAGAVWWLDPDLPTLLAPRSFVMTGLLMMILPFVTPGETRLASRMGGKDVAVKLESSARDHAAAFVTAFNAAKSAI